MAEEIILHAQLDTGTTEEQLNGIEKSLRNISKQDAVAGATKQFNDLNKIVDTAALSFQDMTKAMENYKNVAAVAGRESPIGQEALKQAAILQDRINGLSADVNVLAHDGQNLQAALQLGTAVTAGYTAFQGVVAMLGVENEKLMETMVKLQAAQSVLAGIEQVRLSLEKESFIMIKARTIATKAMAGAELFLAKAIAGTTGATKLFRIALISTGIGAIVVAIGMLIANFDKLSDGINNNAKWWQWLKKSMMFVLPPLYLIVQNWEKLKSVFDSLIDPARELLGMLSREEEKLAEQSEKRIELLAKESEEIGKRYDFEIEKLRASGKETFKVEQEKRRAVLETLKIEANAILELVKLTGEFSDEQRDRLKEISDQAKKLSQELVVARIAHEKQVTDKARENAKERAKLAKEEADKAKEEAQKAAEFRENLEKKLTELSIANIQDETLRRQMELNFRQEQERQQLIKEFGENNALLAELRQKQWDEQIALENQLKEEKKVKDDEERIAQLELELVKIQEDEMAKIAKEREMLEFKNQQGLMSEAEYLQAKQQLDQREVEFEEQKNEAIFQSRLALATAIGDVFGELATLAGENERAQKAFALAQVGIDLAKSISSLTAASAANPANAVTAGAAGAIQYATGLAQVLSSINQARQILRAGNTQVKPPSRPSSSLGGGGSSSGSSNNNQNNGFGGFGNEGTTSTNQNQSMRVYVVESDITKKQESAKKVEVLSSI